MIRRDALAIRGKEIVPRSRDSVLDSIVKCDGKTVLWFQSNGRHYHEVALSHSATCGAGYAASEHCLYWAEYCLW